MIYNRPLGLNTYLILRADLESEALGSLPQTQENVPTVKVNHRFSVDLLTVTR